MSLTNEPQSEKMPPTTSDCTPANEHRGSPAAVLSLPTALPRDVHWMNAIATPFTSLGSKQAAVLSVSVGVAFALTLITSVVVEAKHEIFYTGALSAGQLSGFFFVYFAAIFAGALQYGGASIALGFSEEIHSVSKAAAEFGGYMVLFFLSDRTTILPRAAKRHDMNLFWTMWALLVAASLFTLRRAKPSPPPTAAAVPTTHSAAAAATAGSVEMQAVASNGGGGGESAPSHAVPSSAAAASAIEEGAGAANALALQRAQDEHQRVVASGDFHVKHLQRDQTEEWKGWMQMMFLWYHYFNASEIYNVIRLYIAAYVWMTGFGNFSYYYIRKDFSMNRFAQMQWRLNFMVTWVCAILGNEYMLYYICPLHTIFTLFIYFGLGIKSQINYTSWGLTLKFGVLILIAFVMWDVKGVFSTVWAPLTFLLKYSDPYRPERAPLSEWEFRTFLDHFVWIVGMFMACNHPRFDLWLERLDAMRPAARNGIKAAVVAGCVGGFYWYYNAILSLPKKKYNAVHPYTSFIPIVLFIILRNISTRARQYHLHLFEFLGKTTLETYIAQFHIWMATTGLNGSPKKILAILPEDWFISNFVLMTVLFFGVSYRLFQCTNAIKPLVVPSKATDDLVKRNVVVCIFVVAAVYVACSLFVMFRGVGNAQAVSA